MPGIEDVLIEAAADPIGEQPTKLQAFCGALMESSWLAAVVASPLLFNSQAANLGEPEKAYIVRSLAFLGAGAWLLARLDGAGKGSQKQSFAWTGFNRLRNPISMAAAALAVANIISTVMSVAPRLSWWGSCERMQGTYTAFSYLLLFAVAADTLRSQTQWRRLQFALILTSVPVASYAIIQRLGFDPIGWKYNSPRRSASTFGNPIFLGAYLIMIIPITGERMLSAARAWFSNKNRRLNCAFLWIATIAVLVIQIIAVLLSQSRGPLLSLSVGAFIFVFAILRGLGDSGRASLAAWIRGTATGLIAMIASGIGMLALLCLPRAVGGAVASVCLILLSALYLVPLLKRRGPGWLWISWLTQVTVLVSILLIVNLHGSNFEIHKYRIHLGRLTQLNSAELGTLRVRILIWQGSVKAFWAHPPLADFRGRSDSFALVRPVFGHGPETLRTAFRRFYPAELAVLEESTAEPDRAHNEVLDQLVTTGALGLLAFLMLFAVAAYWGMRGAGLLSCRKDTLVFFSAIIVLSLAGLVLPLALRHGEYVGPGIGLGMPAAVVFYVLYRALCSGEIKIGPRETVALSILAAIIAHFIELQFGIATVATRVLYFLYIAVLAALEGGEPMAPACESVVDHIATRQLSAGKLSRRSPIMGERKGGLVPKCLGHPMLPYAAIGAIAFVVISWDFVVVRQPHSGLSEVFWNSYFSVLHGRQLVAAPGAIWIALLTFAAGSVLALGYSAAGGSKDAGKRLNGTLLFLFVTAGVWMIYGMFKARQIIAAFGFSSPEDAAEYVASYVVSFYVWFFVLVLSMAVILWKSEFHGPQMLPFNRRLSPILGAGIFVCLSFIAYETALKPSRASVLLQLATKAANQNLQHSLELHRRASAADPGQDLYYFRFGSALLKALPGTGDAVTKARLLADAEVSLKKALELDSFNSNYCLQLGILQSFRSHSLQKEERRGALQEAISWFKKAAELSPNTGSIYQELGSVCIQLGDWDSAKKHFEHSISLDPKNTQAYVFMARLETLRGDLKEALRAYDHALGLNWRNAEALEGKGFVLASLGHDSDAIQAYRGVLAIDPQRSTALQNLALLYGRSRDFQKALQYAQMALPELSQQERPAFEKLIESFQKQLVEQGRPK